MPLCSECGLSVNRVYTAAKLCSKCCRAQYSELVEGEMNYLQFRAAVVQLYGKRKHKDYAALFGISGGAFTMFWNGNKPISRPMKQRLKIAYEDQTKVTIKKPAFLIYYDPNAKDPHHTLWPSGRGLGHQLWLLINQEIPMSKSQFLLNFDRIALTYFKNIALHTELERRVAWNRAPQVWESLKDKRVMILDSETANIIGYPVINPEPYMVWREFKGVTFCRFPRRDQFAAYNEQHFPVLTKKLVEVYFDWLSPV